MKVNVPGGSHDVPAGTAMCHWPVGHHKITALMVSLFVMDSVFDILALSCTGDCVGFPFAEGMKVGGTRTWVGK